MRKKNRWAYLAALAVGCAAIAGCGAGNGGKKTTAADTKTESAQEKAEGAETMAEETDAAESGSVEVTLESDAENGSEDTTDESELETKNTETTGTHTITDHAGREVEIPDEIHRIAVTDTLPLPSVLSLFLDSADSIVGISPVSMSAAKNGLLGELYPELLDADTQFFANNELNIEALAALEPDLVFYNAGSTAIEEALENAGLTAVAVSVTKWNFDAAETYEQWLALLEEIFPEKAGTAQKAKDACDQVQEEIDEKTKSLKEEEKKRVFWLFNYSDAGIVTSGERFWGQYWCDAVNAVNVSKEVPAEKSNAVVNMEQIYSWDPQVIFISNFTSANPKDLYENTISDYDWSSIQAVKDQQVYKMPLGAYRTFTPGADTPMTLLWVAKQVYPELFAEEDLADRTKAYYQDVFGVSLTDEQAAGIYPETQPEQE